MPIFDYLCPICQTIQEDVIQFTSDEKPVLCPVCYYEMNKKISSPGFCYVKGGGSGSEYGQGVEFVDELDRRREAAAKGHGNSVIKMSMDSNGNVSTDSIETTGEAFKNAYKKQD